LKKLPPKAEKKRLNNMTDIKEAAEYIIKAVVSNSDEVQVFSRLENELTILEVSAPPEIVGQIIGKDGKIIKSIRTLLNLAFPEIRYLLQIKE
ncbi:MAG TPA: KH domain-containing protein, partial [Candidatus Woesebacteria bacterium]|nr:KH domain-containing protein [Candidatus Woesebacteria bacterium]